MCVCVQGSLHFCMIFFLILDRETVRNKVRHAGVCVCVWNRGDGEEHEYMHAGKHVGGCLVHFHTPTQKAFGACCATAHSDSATDLINLLLAPSTKWSCELRPTVNSVRLRLLAFDWNKKMKLFFDTSPRKQSWTWRRHTRRQLHTRTHSSSSMETSKGDHFFLEKLLWTGGAGQSKRCFFNKEWQVLQPKPRPPSQGSADVEALHRTITLLCEAL